MLGTCLVFAHVDNTGLKLKLARNNNDERNKNKAINQPWDSMFPLVDIYTRHR